MDKIEIEWDDAAVELHEIPLENAKESIVIPAQTIGFLLNETEEYITLTSSIFNHDTDYATVRCTWTIPRKMIKAIHKVERID